MWKTTKTEISKQNKHEDGICCFKANNESTCHQKLLIPLTIFFLSIVDKIYLNLKNSNNTDKSNYLCYVTQLSEGSFPHTKFKNTSTQEMENIIKSIHGKNSHKYDDISTKVLKFSAPFVSSPINYICNTLLSKGTAHSRLKFLEIKPLHKGRGDVINMFNYRPFSLLTSFSKIFEKGIYVQDSLHTQITIISCWMKNLVLDKKCQQYWLLKT